MDIDAARLQVRSRFLGGSVGQLVTGIIWLFSAALSTFVGHPHGILALVLGGMLIFPLTQLALKLTGTPGFLTRDNPLNPLPLQSVFAMVAMYPLIYAAALHNVNWFYPAFMIVVGAHYVSFIFLYGMWQYGVLASFFIAAGTVLGLFLPNSFEVGSWLAGLVLVLFACVIWFTAPWKEPHPAAARSAR